jgi:hypothetical protein
MFHRWKLRRLLAGICLTWLFGVVNAAEPLVTSRAYVGEPFGVGEVTIQYSDDVTPWHTDQLLRIVAMDRERVYYPASKIMDTPHETQGRQLRVKFLFQGKKERRVRIHAIEPITVPLLPLDDANAHKLLLKEWWDLYNDTRDPSLDSDHSVQLKNYLCSMLSLRTGLQPPPNQLWRSSVEQVPAQRFINQTLGRLTGATSIRVAMQSQRMLVKSSPQEAVNLPLPEAALPPAVPVPEKLQPDTEVEAIALHVPAECFYARCQRFADYLWLRDLADAWGGTVDSLVAQESFDYGLGSSVERRLAITLNEQDRDKLDESISDLAIIGTDLFFRDGPSVGMLLEAKDDRTLAEVIRLNRDAVRSEPGALEHEIRLGDHTARLLTTPDGTVRSIYAISGKYHLITTSSFIARKFLACNQGEGSLGKLQKFRYARQKLPPSRKDQAFLYLSEPFFQLLVSPAYRVEMQRRAAALADLQIVEMARLAAEGEGKDLPTIDLLRNAGYLTKGLGVRADGTSAMIVNGRARDSLRGMAGGMLPIPDVEITGVTLSEAESYRSFAIEHQRQWPRFDPVTVAIARKPGDKRGQETVALDFMISPHSEPRFRFMPIYLKANPQRLSMAEDMLALLEGTIVGATVFAGVKDLALPLLVEAGQIVEQNPNPYAEVLSPTDFWELPFCGITAETDEAMNTMLNFYGSGFGTHPTRKSELRGFVEASDPKITGVRTTNLATLFKWGRFQKGMVTFGKSRDDLEKLAPVLRLVDADRPAQIRFRMKDLEGTKLGRATDTVGYLNARRLSAANARLLWQFDQQLQLPPEEIPTATARVFGGQLYCPLGGEYVLGDGEAAPALWSNSAWDTDSLKKVDRVPENYRFPFTAWMRELSIDFMIDATTLSTHVEATWQR